VNKGKVLKEVVNRKIFIDKLQNQNHPGFKNEQSTQSTKRQR
jgi:hypothetical protein